MPTDFDVIVIGSGFGGAITGCRLAEAGYKVLILERGRRWRVEDYPRALDDDWVWDQEHPEKRNGWLDFRVYPNMAIAQGAGVGGGSLIYANISVEAKPDLFQKGWPPEITYDELKPYYDRVGRMMNIQQIPENQWTPRTKLMKEGADNTGYGDRFQLLNMAVAFDPKWNYELPDAHGKQHSKTFTNDQGQEQGTCVHLGNCDIGCDVKAKNTLDLNYIPVAEQNGAEVRPLHIATRITPVADGYRVDYDRLAAGQRAGGSATGRLVILAAGSLGSTELLLRCRDEFRTLPNLSSFLGHGWSSNGDFLTPAFHKGRDVRPTRGPTITAAIDFLGDRSLNNQHFFIEDGGFPDVIGNYLQSLQNKPLTSPRVAALLQTIRLFLRQEDPLKITMPWFAQGRDAADGTLTLRRKLFGRRELHLEWKVRQSEQTINAIVDMHKKLARATGGEPMVPITWQLSKDLITPHPLGGCNMGPTAALGVVDHRGAVFGYPNLYVADGGIVPEAIGANPSKTIGALAERVAKIIVEEGR
ncbi:MAG: GMC family oxidoreductase [Bryobacterales bacterium]